MMTQFFMESFVEFRTGAFMGDHYVEVIIEGSITYIP